MSKRGASFVSTGARSNKPNGRLAELQKTIGATQKKIDELKGAIANSTMSISTEDKLRKEIKKYENKIDKMLVEVYAIRQKNLK